MNSKINKKNNSKYFLSAIIACYNDQQAIPIMHKRLTNVFKKINCKYEIIFVCDGSPDDSEKILKKICLKDKKTIAIIHSRNFSSQNAFSSGMNIARGDAVILLDGDLQDPPELIEKFFEKWINGFQVVYGRRVKREGSLLLGFCYKLFYRIFNKLSYIHVPHDAGDFSLMDKKVYQSIKYLPEKDLFIRGLRAWVGFKQTGVDYKRPERLFGKSTNNIFRNIKWAKKGIFSFSNTPLEMISYLAITVVFFSFLAMIFYITTFFLYPDVPRGFTTMFVLILFLGGIQLLSISIISEYIGKILEESKNRPKFIIDKIYNKPKSNMK